MEKASFCLASPRATACHVKRDPVHPAGKAQRLTKEMPTKTSKKPCSLGIDDMAPFPTKDWLRGQPAFRKASNLKSKNGILYKRRMDCGLWTSSLLAATCVFEATDHIAKFCLPTPQTPLEVVDFLLQLNLPLFRMGCICRLEQCL